MNIKSKFRDGRMVPHRYIIFHMKCHEGPTGTGSEKTNWTSIKMTKFFMAN